MIQHFGHRILTGEENKIIVCGSWHFVEAIVCYRGVFEDFGGGLIKYGNPYNTYLILFLVTVKLQLSETSI